MANRRRPVVLPLLVIALLLAGASGCQRGGGYPNKPITMIIPLAAGAGPDVNFRLLADEASKHLGQQIVAVNKPGAGGSVGMTELTQAKPDGYTIAMSAVAMLTTQPVITELAFKGPQDFQPVMQVLDTPSVFYARTEAPWKTAQDVLNEAKTKPGAIRVASPERFNVFHVELERLKELSGADLGMIPFPAGQQLTAVLAGTTELAVSQTTLALPQVQAGQVRVLGVFGEKRVPGIEAPTFKEMGYDIPQTPYEFLLAPKGTPQDIVQKLHDAFKLALESEKFRAQADQAKFEIAYLNPTDLAARLDKDAQVYGDIARRLNWRASQ